MSSLRAAAARTRAINPFQSLSTSKFYRPISTRGNDSESDRDKRPSLPHHPSSLMDNAPGWNEDLATASEAFVKADRETIQTTLGEMQRKTVDYAHWQAHRERRDPEVEQTHATYSREEIGGPLGAAGMGEFEGVVGNDDLGPDEAQVESNGRVVARRVTTHEKTTVSDGGSVGQAKV